MNNNSLTKYVECDSVRRLIYNIQVEKDLDDEDDLWDMPDEDDEMDLSVGLCTVNHSIETYG